MVFLQVVELGKQNSHNSSATPIGTPNALQTLTAVQFIVHLRVAEIINSFWRYSSVIMRSLKLSSITSLNPHHG